jgi:16S rRNA C1402 (ribose-2'-O) methylase RsmI
MIDFIVKNPGHTVVFFEAPHRILTTMIELEEKHYLGLRPCICCREMTKVYEEFRRGSVHDMISWLQSDDSPTKVTYIRNQIHPDESNIFTMPRIAYLSLCSSHEQRSTQCLFEFLFYL